MASGGTTPYTFSWTGYADPEGFTLNPATGAITGTTPGQGVYDPLITVTDAAGATATATAALAIAGDNAFAASIFFPPDHFLHGWDISALPVDTSPAAPPSLPGTLRLVGGHSVADTGFALNHVPGSQPNIPINCIAPYYACGASSGPFTPNTALEGGSGAYAGGGDAHANVVEDASATQPAKLYDTWRSYPSTNPPPGTPSASTNGT